MRIGNRRDALTIHGYAMEGDDSPSDFEALSGGGCREVYAKGDVVYKVQTDFEYYMRGYGNLTEYRHATALRKASDNGFIGRVYIPRVTGYFVAGSTPVLAMEYIYGREADKSQKPSPPEAEALWQLFNLGFGDMHAANYRWLPGRKVIVSPIDMGSTRHLSSTWNKADSRCLSGTDYSRRVSAHRDYHWRNKERQRFLAPSCPCGCGVLRWTHETK